MRSGKLKVGDRLPPERQLARDFNVNRVTVWEAMHLLWERGLIERRNRNGIRIVSRELSTVGADVERYFILSSARAPGTLDWSCLRDRISLRLGGWAAVFKGAHGGWS